MKRRQKRKHLENEESQETAEKGGGISKSQEDPPQLGCTAMAQVCPQGSGEVSSASEYFSCVSSPRKLIHGEKDRVLELSPRAGPCCSGPHTSHVHPLSTHSHSQPRDQPEAGIWKLHRDSPQPRAPLAHLQEQGEMAPLSPRVSSSPSSYKTCATSLHMNKEKRGMKIYYMQVQMKKGVAVSWEAERPSESLEKQPRMEEVTLPEDVRVGTPPSDVSTRNLLSDSEPSGEEREHEERAEADSPAPGSSTVEERPRARTPDWLVTMETGFRCMACCRVFPSLEVLQEHVQNGIREGFSCHVFHLTMAQLTGKAESENTPEEEVEDEDEDEDGEDEKQEEKEKEEQQPAGEDVSLRRPWSQCPGCVFHSPKDRK